MEGKYDFGLHLLAPWHGALALHSFRTCPGASPPFDAQLVHPAAYAVLEGVETDHEFFGGIRWPKTSFPFNSVKRTSPRTIEGIHNVASPLSARSNAPFALLGSGSARQPSTATVV
ncbi:MAG: hypothetical protein JRN11_08075 [Nitrososphaerota archaeon]|nr:hypothetical protein [Nitrososphaerota archaeon]MDG7026690.1 hypothetical protein [Nitrososphaerota archaeon]